MGPLRTQMFHACLDAVEAVVAETARSKGKTRSGPKWPANLILGEEAESKVVHSEDDGSTKSCSPGGQKKQKQCSQPRTRSVRTASMIKLRSDYFPAVCAFSRSIAFWACSASGPCGRIFK